MAISKRLRYEILRRDNHACRYCGRAAPDVPLRVDHVIPVALGGTDDPENLAAACHDCNTGKSSVPADAPLVERANDDMLRWRHAMQLMADIATRDREQRDADRELFRAAWIAWRYPDGRTDPLPPDWPETIDRFIAAGLTADDIRDAVDGSLSQRFLRDPFRYFCGVCWRMIANRQQSAAAYLRETSGGSDGA